DDDGEQQQRPQPLREEAPPKVEPFHPLPRIPSTCSRESSGPGDPMPARPMRMSKRPGPLIRHALGSIFPEIPKYIRDNHVAVA
ncbi:MAG: hypothetical protein OXC15_18970, partial [Rhodospirillaceae bacterium]|nr:hypothetical protein [Rhodospirillaceae bacterium]